jgi:hypothetical protein
MEIKCADAHRVALQLRIHLLFDVTDARIHQ